VHVHVSWVHVCKMLMCVFVCVCVRVCMHACACADACMYPCIHRCMHGAKGKGGRREGRKGQGVGCTQRGLTQRRFSQEIRASARVSQSVHIEIYSIYIHSFFFYRAQILAGNTRAELCVSMRLFLALFRLPLRLLRIELLL